MADGKLQIKLFSSLVKIFADQSPEEIQSVRGTMLKNEVFSFQAAYSWKKPNETGVKKNIRVCIHSALSPWITVRKVGLVPSELPCFADHDTHVLRTVPGLYPDPLFFPGDDDIVLLPEQWRSLWITVNPDGQAEAGEYPIEIRFEDSNGEELGTAVFQLEVLPVSLPAQRLIHTEWFHADCLATYYGLEVFSEEHWKRIGQFMETAVKHGVNMISTPLFTPPLDTAVGGERPTVQLVEVKKSDHTYSFRFDRLQRWVDLCREKGFQYFEFFHFFTQWGARHAPKIVAEIDGVTKRIFGWETDAAGEEYISFLNLFIHELLAFIRQNNLENRSFFHVSDEPCMEDLDDYRKAAAIIKPLLKGYPIIDALSDYTFYETGVVQHPVPASDHIMKFIENRVPGLWTYYCCSQYNKVSNRFFNMPSARNRILGIQLYKYNIKGFLHWGYNFYYSQYSRHPVDPFRVTDAGCAFPSGDAFLVYPGDNGPIESIRLEVLYEALQDLRALELLEKFMGREKVVDMLEEGLEQPITFDEYPKEAGWLLQKREQINRMLNTFFAG